MPTEGLAAGSVSSWLRGTRAALRRERDGDVPCGGCTACCRSSQFVAVEPDETDALAHIPAELLFPAPGAPAGHVVLGYDANGHCPMLVDDGCSIYEHRPRACRTYDCRVYAATAITVDRTQPAVRERVERWQFDVLDERDAAELAAVRAAGVFLSEHDDIGHAHATKSPLQLAVLAVVLSDLFLDGEPSVDDLRRELARRTA